MKKVIYAGAGELNYRKHIGKQPHRYVLCFFRSRDVYV
jgi:hypothetical protein